jgi:hypothetical protein
MKRLNITVERAARIAKVAAIEDRVGSTPLTQIPRPSPSKIPCSSCSLAMNAHEVVNFFEFVHSENARSDRSLK